VERLCVGHHHRHLRHLLLSLAGRSHVLVHSLTTCRAQLVHVVVYPHRHTVSPPPFSGTSLLVGSISEALSDVVGVSGCCVSQMSFADFLRFHWDMRDGNEEGKSLLVPHACAPRLCFRVDSGHRVLFFNKGALPVSTGAMSCPFGVFLTS
jgi:hypothetical protein